MKRHKAGRTEKTEGAWEREKSLFCLERRKELNEDKCPALTLYPFFPFPDSRVFLRLLFLSKGKKAEKKLRHGNVVYKEILLNARLCGFQMKTAAAEQWRWRLFPISFTHFSLCFRQRGENHHPGFSLALRRNFCLRCFCRFFLPSSHHCFALHVSRGNEERIIWWWWCSLHEERCLPGHFPRSANWVRIKGNHNKLWFSS